MRTDPVSEDSRFASHRVMAMIPVGVPRAETASVVKIATAVAASSGAPVEALLLGAPTQEDGRQAAEAGASKVWLASHPELAGEQGGERLAAGFAAALLHPQVAQGGQPMLCVFAAGPPGEETAARLAVRLNGAALGRCEKIILGRAGLATMRPGFGGKARLTASYGMVSCFAAMRPPVSETQAVPATGEPRITAVALDGALPARASIARSKIEMRSASLQGARVVVSGGRGMGGPEGFALLQELATCLGAGLGGSLPTVDAGWVPVARQVGQSGKFVTPDIYIGVGISGTPQHMAGIGQHARIAAINSDPDADIFRFAEIGAVSDWRILLPVLIGALQAEGKAKSE